MARQAASPDARALGLLMQRVRGKVRAALALLAVSALIWLIQAAFAAHGVAGMFGSGGDMWLCSGGFVISGVFRAFATYGCEGLLFAAGTRGVTQTRSRIVAREARSSDGMAASAVAALAGEKLDLLLPYITRHAPGVGG